MLGYSLSFDLVDLVGSVFDEEPVNLLQGKTRGLRIEEVYCRECQECEDDVHDVQLPPDVRKSNRTSLHNNEGECPCNGLVKNFSIIR
jgi:hypothetical protein